MHDACWRPAEFFSRRSNTSFMLTEFLFLEVIKCYYLSFPLKIVQKLKNPLISSAYKLNFLEQSIDRMNTIFFLALKILVGTSKKFSNRNFDVFSFLDHVEAK